MSRPLTDDSRAALEALVDSHGLAEVLNGLAQVCSEKADRLRSNWQDNAGARLWEKAATRISYTVATAAIGGVS